MKKLMFILSIATILLVSCEKEDLKLKSTSGVNNSEEKLISSLHPVERQVNNFIEKIDLVRSEPDFEGSEEWNYSIDSANWYMEAAFNYKYCYPNRERADLQLDSFDVNITLNSENYINIHEIVSLIDSIHYNIGNVYNEIETEEKFLIGVDLSYSYESELILYVRYYIGLYDIHLPDGDWRVAYNGMCNVSGYNSFAAPNKIMQELYNANSIHQTSVFFTNQEPIWEAKQYCTVDMNFNYSPCNVSALYSEENWDASAMLTCLTEPRMDIYISNAVSSLSYVQENFEKTFYIYNIYFTFDLIVIGQEPYRHYYMFMGEMANAVPRELYNQDDTYLN